jgi:hypothetical protein
MFDMLGGSWVRWHGVSTQIAKATSSHRIAMITLGVTRVSDRRKLAGPAASGKADSIYLSYSSQANRRGRAGLDPSDAGDERVLMSYCVQRNGTRRGASYSTGSCARLPRIAIIMRAAPGRRSTPAFTPRACDSCRHRYRSPGLRPAGWWPWSGTRREPARRT